MRAKIIILLILLILFTIFVTQNTEQTIMNVFFWTVEMPKIVLLIITLVIGVVLGLIAVTAFSNSNKKKIKMETENLFGKEGIQRK
jgi:uncharacterized integral membrane protein